MEFITKMLMKLILSPQALINVSFVLSWLYWWSGFDSPINYLRMVKLYYDTYEVHAFFDTYFSGRPVTGLQSWYIRREFAMPLEKQLDLLKISGAIALALNLFFLLVKIMPRVFALLKLIRGRISRVYQKVTDNVSFMPEKMMPGSNLEYAPLMPGFQAEIWVTNGGVFYKSGSGFLAEGTFWTAYHVIEDATEVKLKTKSGEVDFKIDRFVHKEGDIAMLVLSEQERSKLGLKQAKFYREMITNGIFVKTYSFSQSSMGLLEKNPAFGFATFTGSTIKGFSGSPYFCGNTIFGMHIGGSVNNMGYESAYLAMISKAYKEDSDDWLEDQLMNEENEIEYRVSPYDQSEVQVCLRGRYYVMDHNRVEELVEQKKGKRMKQKHNVHLTDDFEQEALSECSSESEFIGGDAYEEFDKIARDFSLGLGPDPYVLAVYAVREYMKVYKDVVPAKQQKPKQNENKVVSSTKTAMGAVDMEKMDEIREKYENIRQQRVKLDELEKNLEKEAFDMPLAVGELPRAPRGALEFAERRDLFVPPGVEDMVKERMDRVEKREKWLHTPKVPAGFRKENLPADVNVNAKLSSSMPSGNGKGAPTPAGAGALGQEEALPSAPIGNNLPCSSTESESQKDSARYHTNGHASIPALQKEALRSTAEDKKRLKNARKRLVKKNKMLVLQQRLQAIANGELPFQKSA